jgi:hypothetical protein
MLTKGKKEGIGGSNLQYSLKKASVLQQQIIMAEKTNVQTRQASFSTRGRMRENEDIKSSIFIKKRICPQRQITWYKRLVSKPVRLLLQWKRYLLITGRERSYI